MHDKFIEMSQELEDNIIYDKIKIKNKDDWNRLKEIVWNLGELYKEEEEKSQNITETKEKAITIENCQNFAKMVWKYMKQMEIEHKMDLDECLETIMEHLRFLVLYNRLGAYRRELMEQYKLEIKENNEISFIEVEDVFDKKYPKKRIKKSDYPSFKESYEQQIEMNKELKIEIIESYNKDVVDLRNEIVTGKLKIENVQQWKIFKMGIANFLKSYATTFSDLKRINHFSYRNDQSPFLTLIFECLEKVEEKYNGILLEADIPMLFDFIRVISHNHLLEEELNKIVVFTSKAPVATENSNAEDKVLVRNKYGKIVSIDKSIAKRYEALENEIEELSEKYQEAQIFIYGQDLKTGEKNKRVM